MPHAAQPRRSRAEAQKGLRSAFLLLRSRAFLCKCPFQGGKGAGKRAAACLRVITGISVRSPAEAVFGLCRGAPEKQR